MIVKGTVNYLDKYFNKEKKYSECSAKLAVDLLKKVALFMERSNSKENADVDAEVLSLLVPQKKSYAAAVAHRESRPLARILPREDSEEKRAALALKTLTWRIESTAHALCTFKE